MSDVAYIPSIVDGTIDYKSPVAAIALLIKFKDSIDLLQGLLEDKPSLILQGAMDETPPDQVSSFIIDSNPTAGGIDRDDKFNGITLKITSGSAQGSYVITDTVASLDKLIVVENLGDLGALSGDTYELRGHSHNGFDSDRVDSVNVDGLTSVTPVPSGTVIFVEAATCPTGYTGLGFGTTRFYIGGPTTGTAGTDTHGHGGGTTAVGSPETAAPRFKPQQNHVAGTLDWVDKASVPAQSNGDHTHSGLGLASIPLVSLDLRAVRFQPCSKD